MEVNPDLEKNLKEDPVRFFQINILHYCSTDQMEQLSTWLGTYDYDVITGDIIETQDKVNEANSKVNNAYKR